MGSDRHLAARVQRVTPAGAYGVTIELDLRLAAQPGQFVMAWLPRVDEKPFSLVDCEPATLAVAEVGPFTARMQRLQVGEALYLRGPLGHGFSLAGERPLLVGGGAGAAPLAFLARRLCEKGRPITVALGARTAAAAMLAERFRSLGAQVLVSTDDGSAGERGLVTDLAARCLARGMHDHIYACGPVPMLQKVADLCRAYGVSGEVSREAYMRCGIGICGSCDCGDGQLVCRDGPAFTLQGR